MDKEFLKKIIIAIALLIFVVIVAFWAVLPKNYDECILKNAEDAQTERAVVLIARACRNKFPRVLLETELLNANP